MAVVKNITWIKGKGKHYHFPFNIEAVGKDLSGREGEWNFGEVNKDYKKMGLGKNIKLY